MEDSSPLGKEPQKRYMVGTLRSDAAFTTLADTADAIGAAFVSDGTPIRNNGESDAIVQSRIVRTILFSKYIGPE